MRQLLHTSIALFSVLLQMIEDVDPDWEGMKDRKIFLILKQLQLNVTTDFTANSTGEYRNGSYTGLLERVQTKKADISAIPMPYIVNGNAFTFSPVVDEWQFALHSMTKPDILRDLDVCTSLNNIGFKCWLILTLFAVLYYKAVKLMKENIKSIDIYASFFEHYYPNFRQYKTRALCSLTAICFAFVFDAITADFSTNLCVAERKATIDELDDLMNITVSYVTFEEFMLREYFSKSKTHIAKIILQRMDDVHSDHVQLRFHTNMMKYRDKLTTIFKLITSDSEKFQGFTNREQYYKISKPFLRRLLAYPMRNGLEYKLKQRWNEFFSFLLEAGVYHKLFADQLVLTARRITMSPGGYRGCEAEFRNHLFHKRSNQYIDIKLMNFISPISVLLLIAAAALCVLKAEIIMRKW